MGVYRMLKDQTSSFGGVLIDGKGRVLLREVSGQYDGYTWTFPKGRPNSNETHEETALREVYEETGYCGQIIGKVPGTFTGGTGTTEYFLVHPIGNPDKFDIETSSVRWVSVEDAQDMINLTQNQIGRKRDLHVLAAAVEEFNRSKTIT